MSTGSVHVETALAPLDAPASHHLVAEPAAVTSPDSGVNSAEPPAVVPTSATSAADHVERKATKGPPPGGSNPNAPKFVPASRAPRSYDNASQWPRAQPYNSRGTVYFNGGGGDPPNILPDAGAVPVFQPRNDAFNNKLHGGYGDVGMLVSAPTTYAPQQPAFYPQPLAQQVPNVPMQSYVQVPPPGSYSTVCYNTQTGGGNFESTMAPSVIPANYVATTTQSMTVASETTPDTLYYQNVPPPPLQMPQLLTQQANYGSYSTSVQQSSGSGISAQKAIGAPSGASSSSSAVYSFPPPPLPLQQHSQHVVFPPPPLGQPLYTNNYQPQMMAPGGVPTLVPLYSVPATGYAEGGDGGGSFVTGPTFQQQPLVYSQPAQQQSAARPPSLMHINLQPGQDRASTADVATTPEGTVLPASAPLSSSAPPLQQQQTQSAFYTYEDPGMYAQQPVYLYNPAQHQYYFQQGTQPVYVMSAPPQQYQMLMPPLPSLDVPSQGRAPFQKANDYPPAERMLNGGGFRGGRGRGGIGGGGGRGGRGYMHGQQQQIDATTTNKKEGTDAAALSETLSASMHVDSSTEKEESPQPTKEPFHERDEVRKDAQKITLAPRPLLSHDIRSKKNDGVWRGGGPTGLNRPNPSPFQEERGAFGTKRRGDDGAPRGGRTVYVSSQRGGFDRPSGLLGDVPGDECGYCKSMKMPFSHLMRDEHGKTTCPVLRRMVCKWCGGTGDTGHTEMFCEHKGHRDGVAQSRAPRPMDDAGGSERVPMERGGSVRGRGARGGGKRGRGGFQPLTRASHHH